MGYRSTVILGVPQDKKAEVVEVLAKDQLRYIETDNGEMSLFKLEGIKWYIGYEIIMELRDLIFSLNDEDDISFFVAHGEDGAIHDQCGDPWEFVCHISYIDFS